MLEFAVCRANAGADSGSVARDSRRAQDVLQGVGRAGLLGGPEGRHQEPQGRDGAADGEERRGSQRRDPAGQRTTPGAGRRSSVADRKPAVRRDRPPTTWKFRSTRGECSGAKSQICFPAAQRRRLGLVVHRAGSADRVPDAFHVSAVAALFEANSASSGSVLRHSRTACVPRSIRSPKAF